MNLAEHGAELLVRAAAPSLPYLQGLLETYDSGRAGSRLTALSGLSPVIAAMRGLHRFIEESARPVRAILFDKNAQTNWALGWHQDRTICVEEKIDTPGFGP